MRRFTTLSGLTLMCVAIGLLLVGLVAAGVHIAANGWGWEALLMAVPGLLGAWTCLWLARWLDRRRA